MFPPFLRKLWNLMTPSERRAASVLAPAEVAMALMQVIGVASVLPFLTLVTDPNALTTNATFQMLQRYVHFSSDRQAVIAAGFGSLAVLVLSNGVAALTAVFEARFVWRLHQQLQFKLMRAYLDRRYEFFLDRNSAELGKNILEEVSLVITGVVFPALQMLAAGLVTVFIVALLVAMNPVLGGLVLVSFGSLYALFFLLVNRFLSRLGKQRVQTARFRFQSIREAFSAIKDVKAHGHEAVFLRGFDKHSRDWASITMKQTVVQRTPRFILELFVFGGIIGIVLYFVIRGEDVSRILPTLGLYAVGSFRLMPSLHRLYESSAKLRGSLPALDVLHGDAHDLVLPRASAGTPAAAPLTLHHGLTFRDVGYRYPGAEHDALSGISAVFEPGSLVAIVGGTGAGKTTLIDLLLGLLTPTSGTILLDGTDLDRYPRDSWQAALGYVPQAIFLADASVAENIAFGVPREDIDEQRLHRAAKAACIYDFVVSQLPHGFATSVGEQGMRLSGGQRQRIGIARALYRDPKVLVLDEATNALDTVTEDAVIQGIRATAGGRLVVMVAHRLSTVRACDAIMVLADGRLTARGTYDQLLNTNPIFQALARKSGDSAEERHAV